MKLGLCVFFNYAFPRNIPIWRELYGHLFEEIIFIQPFNRSTDPDVITVYRASFNFAGYFSDARAALESMDVDAVVFTGDDCILNPTLFGPDFANRFKWSDDVAGFIPEFLPFASQNWWRNRHKIAVLGRFAGSYGVFDQRIEGWQRNLPDPAEVTARALATGLAFGKLEHPPQEEMLKLTAAQAEILRQTFKGQPEVDLPYPLTYAVSDFFIVSKHRLADFCHEAGVLAGMNVFPEAAVPTALLALDGEFRQAKECGLNFQWTYGRNRDAEFFVPTTVRELCDCIDNLPTHTIFVHPVKLSSINHLA